MQETDMVITKVEEKTGKGLSAALNARLVGSGDETIVLAHGYGGDQSAWDKIVPELGRRYRVLLFDWSFSGAIKDPKIYDPEKYTSYDAYAEDLLAVLEEMGLSSTIFVGHSMSGMIGCIASIRKPHLFRRLVLLAASPRYLNTQDYEGGFTKTEIEEIFKSIESNYQDWASKFAPLIVGPEDPPSIDKVEKSMRSVRPEVALAVAKVVFLSDERETLEKVETPCTIVQTTNDAAVPYSVVEYMQKKIKAESTVEIVSTTGHLPQLTAHLQLLRLLDSF